MSVHINRFLFCSSVFIVILISFYINNQDKFFSSKESKLNLIFFGTSKKKAESEEYKYPYIEENLQEKKNIGKVEINKYITVGIDFGSINTGYAYIYGNDISKIITSRKTPTEFILSKQTHKGLHYSTTAQITMTNYRKRELNNIIYIRGLKNILNSKIDTITHNKCFIYPNNIINELNIKNIFIEYFLMLKNDIIGEIYEKLEFNKEEEIEDKILWIIAIPSTWNEFEKQLIKISLYESGMKSNKLIYQSEAASLSIYDDRFILDKFKKKNNKFMIIDAGGYSVDINVNEILDQKGSIKEILSTKTDYLGIYNITEEIIKIFDNFFGKNYINYIKREEPGDWIKILKEINRAIENSYCLEGIEIFDINCNFKNVNPKNFNFTYKNRIYNIKYIGYSLLIPGDLVGEIILTNINNIKYNIEKVLKELNSKSIKIDSLMVMGGFSRNKIFQKEIEEFFNKNYNKIKVHYISSYETIISKGSVLYGINNVRIKSRISPITMGIKNNDKIEILIRKGDELKKSINIIKYLKPVLDNQKKIQINFYCSNEDKLSEDELKKNFFGRLILKINNQKDGIIILNIRYETCLTFYAISYENGREIETEFQFFKENDSLIFY